MTDRMLLIVPSRGRPENIKRLNEALLDTDSDLDFVVGVDEDDPFLAKYQALEEEYMFDLYVGPRRKFAGTVNAIAMENYKRYKYIAWMGDDHIPQTRWWDFKYRQELDKHKVGVVYGNDLVQGKNIATELAFTSNIIEELGYAIPPGFVHLYVDNYFMEIANAIGKLIYLPDVIVQHMHPSAGTAQEDLTYKEANSAENWSNDLKRFKKYVAEELSNDAEKLRKLI